ncbi:MAG: hypothetical protein HYW22_00875 [Candidatus Aenigmarchaeota archaeon]|nr:hypothetical protein [Candidatus Aenigmarchaeota archaeon]
MTDRWTLEWNGHLYALIREMDNRRDIMTLGLDEEHVKRCAEDRNKNRRDRDKKIVETSSGDAVISANYHSESVRLFGDLNSADHVSNGPVVYVVATMSPEHSGVGIIHGSVVNSEIASELYTRLSRMDRTSFYSITPYVVEL